MTADDQAATDDLWAFMEPERPDDDRWVGPPADEAKRLRDQGVTAADHGLDTRWRGAAEAVIAELAATGQPWTSDDVTARVGTALGSATGGMGAVIRSAATRGLIRAAGYVPSTRPEAHGRIVRQWVGTGKSPEPMKPRKPPPVPRSVAGMDATLGGQWTTADEMAACTLCGQPALLRHGGRPRHKDCGGGGRAA